MKIILKLTITEKLGGRVTQESGFPFETGTQWRKQILKGAECFEVPFENVPRPDHSIINNYVYRSERFRNFKIIFK